MGTASTMACILAGLGLIPLRSGATAPATSATRLRVAEETGALAVQVASQKLKPQSILSEKSVLNAITALQAIGGSTNAVVHLMAIVNRHPLLQGKITLDTFDEVGRHTPLLVDLKPSGNNYMTDFHNAGGMLAVMHQLRARGLLHLDAWTIWNQPLGQVLDETPFRPFAYSESIIRPITSEPLYASSSLVVLKGNLAPQGCVLKASASKDRRLLRHTGPAVVFETPAHLAQRVDDPDLEVTRDSVLVLKDIGPVGHPGMPEAGLIPIPRKLAAQGVTDMLRLSDGRMSGTAGGTVVLHISPESAVPTSVFAVVRDGDPITVDVDKRLLALDVAPAEIARRIGERRGGGGEMHDTPSLAYRDDPDSRRGYRGLYRRRVNQAHEGADFDFLTASGPERW